MSTILGKIFRNVSDAVVGLADNTLSIVGAGGVIPNSAYSSKEIAKAMNVAHSNSVPAITAVAGAIIPVAKPILGSLQKLNPYNRPDDVPAPSPSSITSPTGPIIDMPEVSPETDYTTHYVIIGAVMLVLIVSIILFSRK